MSESTRPNWLITLAYDGTGYSGWQIQPERRSIQGVLQEKLCNLFQAQLRVFGCSRTDAGVHALSQRASFCPPDKPPIDELSARRALNSLLPSDIRILRIDKVANDFHARHNAVGKAYSYLLNSEECLCPFTRNHFWSLRCELNLQAMATASKHLIGTHDFTGFSVNSTNSDIQPVKILYDARVQTIGSYIVISIIGNSFLYKMVRRIVGFLVKVGKGQAAPEEASQVLSVRNRAVQFDTAPAHGLYLEEVFYRKEDIFRFQSGEIPFLKLLGLPAGYADLRRGPTGAALNRL